MKAVFLLPLMINLTPFSQADSKQREGEGGGGRGEDGDGWQASLLCTETLLGDKHSERLCQ